MAGLVIVVGAAFGLTSVFNRLRVPTSTIQILVFGVLGAGLAVDITVRSSRIAELAVIWVSAPILAAGFGFLLTKLFDLAPSVRVERPHSNQRLRAATADQAGSLDHPPASGRATSSLPQPGHCASPKAGKLGIPLILVGALASFAIGSNDVANATGSLVGTQTLGPLAAGLVGGLGIAGGVLTWGRPLFAGSPLKSSASTDPWPRQPKWCKLPSYSVPLLSGFSPR